MLKTKDEGIILEKTNLEFENKAVLNPACIQVGDVTHMFYGQLTKMIFRRLVTANLSIIKL